MSHSRTLFPLLLAQQYLQVEVQAETEVMIPDTMRRLAKAVDDLRGYVVSLHDQQQNKKKTAV